MKFTYIRPVMFAAVLSLIAVNCSNDDDATIPMNNEPDFSGTFVQQDQVARPSINTVFVSSGSKDAFNTTVPSQQSAAFQSMFQTKLEALSPAFNEPEDTNLLGFTSSQFSTALATDVLNVSLDGTTTFFDGTNVLTGRALADDVITVELILIFGGEDGSENPGLSDDNVDGNDKQFLSSFPYLAAPF